MNIRTKKTVLSTMILSLILVLVQFTCSNALQTKQASAAPIPITSLQNSTDIKLHFPKNIANSGEEDSLTSDMVTSLLSNMSIHADTKFIVSKDSIMLDMLLMFNLSDTQNSFELWINGSENPKPEDPLLIIKLPKLKELTALFGDKDYLVLREQELKDRTDPSSTTPEGIDFNQFGKFFTSLKEQMKNMSSQITVNQYISDKGNKTYDTPVGKQVAHAYQFKMTDNDFRGFLKQWLTALAANPELSELLNQFGSGLNQNENLSGSMDEDLNSQISKMTEKPLLNDKGLDFEYAVDNDGNLVSLNGTMGLNLNVPDLDTSLGSNDASDKDPSNMSLEVELSSINYNLNKDFKIDLPVLTPANSTDFMSMLSNMIPSLGLDSGLGLDQDQNSTTEIVPPLKTTPDKPSAAKQDPAVSQKSSSGKTAEKATSKSTNPKTAVKKSTTVTKTPTIKKNNATTGKKKPAKASAPKSTKKGTKKK